jgi:hypothetical protein
MHHPLEATQIASTLDETVLNSNELNCILLKHRNHIQLIAFGHIHRAIAGSWHGIPVCCNWATSHQTIYQEHVDARTNDLQRSPKYAYLRLLESGVQAHLRSVDWEAAYRTAKAEMAVPGGGAIAS